MQLSNLDGNHDGDPDDKVVAGGVPLATSVTKSDNKPPEQKLDQAATTDAVPISPSMGPSLEAASVPTKVLLVDRRVVFISLLSIFIAFFAGVAAELLMRLIGLVTNISFYGKFSFSFASPDANHLGFWVIGIPVIGGLIVGIMARYGSSAIRGHGIPEAMEQVLTNQSRIPPRITFLKPLSAAIAIGTGGPFGAEGPIIATGGAFGSLIGQLLSVTAGERKTLLSAGAAAGMSATFGCPVAGVLLAIELLLFEFRPRSFIPVALASVTAAGMRFAFGLKYPIFDMPNIQRPDFTAMMFYLLVGLIVGFVSIGVTRSVYIVEDLFGKLPVHWMWWPAIGALAVGIIGWKCPRTLGVGYFNISDLLNISNLQYSNGGKNVILFVLILGLLKFVSWAISLGSGTSGGTLAPLFTIGSALGALLGVAGMHLLRNCNLDVRVAALVGMASMFAGSSRALLASVVFAFETTLQPLGLLPLMGGCTVAYFVSCLFMPNTIMTEKMARRGLRVPAEYQADHLSHVIVRDAASPNLVWLKVNQTLADVRQWLNSHGPGTSHQGFPVLNEQGYLTGVLTRRDLMNPEASPTATMEQLIHRPPIIVYDDSTLREAADHMVHHNVGRLPVVSRDTRKVIGMISRSDLLGAHRQRLKEFHARPQSLLDLQLEKHKQ